VISTIPTAALQRIAPHLEVQGARASAPPKFLGVIRLALVLHQGLSPYYVTNLIQAGFPFTGIIELSSLASPGMFAGHGFVMLPRYEVPSSPWFDKPDEEVYETFVAALEPMWPNIRTNVLQWYVHRERIVQALWISAPPPAKPWATPDGRVWSINAELAGRDTLNNNAIVRTAGELYREVLSAPAQSVSIETKGETHA
jgi:hypothetical protein